MKMPVFVFAAALGLCGMTPAMAADVQFGCDARAPSVCLFRIFYAQRGGRLITLPAGVKVTVPGLKVGEDHYCVSLGKPPNFKCNQKPVDAKYNS